MNIKLRIITLIAFLVVAIGLGALFLQTDKSGKSKSVSQTRLVTIQLTPLPMVIDSNGKKDNILHKLLLGKISTQVAFQHVNFDIEPVFLFTPLGLKNSSIHFTFNKETNRVEFEGQSNHSKHLKIFGYYEFTSKNHIKYYLNIHDQYKKWKINSTYAPAYKDNESEYKEVVTGDFSLEASDLIKVAYNFNNDGVLPKFPLALQANFVKGENLLDIKNLYLKTKELEANINAKIKEKNVFLDIAVNYINLNKIFHYISRVEIDRALHLLFKKIAPLDIDGSLNCSKVKLNGVDLNSFSILFSKDRKIKNDLKISKLKFSFPDNSVLNSFGTISSHEENIVMRGSLNISDMHSGTLTKILDTKNYNGSSLVSLSSKFELAPRSIKFKNFKIKEGETIVDGDLSFSKYVASKMLIGNMEVSNYNTENPSFIQFMLHGNSLLSKTRSLDYESSLEQNKKRKFLKDVALKFKDLKTTTAVIKRISARYLETQNSIELKDFHAQDPRFDVKGYIGFYDKKTMPHLAVEFIGDKVDMTVFNDLIVKPFMYQVTQSDVDKGIISIPRFSETTGNININLKNPNKETYISAVNCKGQLDKSILKLDGCGVSMFDSNVYLSGIVGLGSNLEYDISFSQENINMNKFISWLLGGNRKIIGKGNADLKGKISASGFRTNEEMMNALKGVIELKSNQISLTNVDVKALTFKYGKIKNIANPKAKSTTLFHNVNGIFNLDNGGITSKDLSFITDDNIHGKTNLNYKLTKETVNGVLSLAYFDKLGKIDGFNIVFYGDVKELNTKLGAYTKNHR